MVRAAFRAIVTGDKIVTANRATIEECASAARKDGHTVRCTIRMAADPRRKSRGLGAKAAG
jgi:hypothetical protein